MNYEQITRKWSDPIARFIRGSSVKDCNVKQCPKCRGTDAVDSKVEGYGVWLLHCSRCDREWLS